MDTAVINVPLKKRGNIDAQLDAYKRDQARSAAQENVQPLRDGVLHLFKGDSPRVFANRTQAEKAAARTGGEAYQNPRSNRFMVRFPGSAQ